MAVEVGTRLNQHLPQAVQTRLEQRSHCCYLLVLLMPLAQVQTEGLLAPVRVKPACHPGAATMLSRQGDPSRSAPCCQR